MGYKGDPAAWGQWSLGYHRLAIALDGFYAVFSQRLFEKLILRGLRPRKINFSNSLSIVCCSLTGLAIGIAACNGQSGAS
jgi:hypothetical protein